MIRISPPVALAIAGVIIIGTVVYSVREERTQPAPTPDVATTTPSAARAPLTESDSDSDGLKDWEETLWSTDPNNPDTDGDGTSDGEEIATNRNPAVPGPNDSLNTHADLTYAPENESERITQNLFGNLLLGESTSTIASSTVDALLGAQATYENKTLSDLTITASNDNTLATYERAFNHIKNSIDPSEIEAQTGPTLTDPDTMAAFAQTARLFEQTHDALLRTPVPSTVATYHLNYLNAIGVAVGHLRNIEKITTDPLVGMTALAELADAIVVLNDARVELELFLTSVSS